VEVDALHGGEQLDPDHARDVLTIRRDFSAVAVAIETWSSCPAEVGIESTLPGQASIRFSDTRAAASPARS
jgi:hypothetical protein